MSNSPAWRIRHLIAPLPPTRRTCTAYPSASTRRRAASPCHLCSRRPLKACRARWRTCQGSTIPSCGASWRRRSRCCTPRRLRPVASAPPSPTCLPSPTRRGASVAHASARNGRPTGRRPTCRWRTCASTPPPPWRGSRHCAPPPRLETPPSCPPPSPTSRVRSVAERSQRRGQRLARAAALRGRHRREAGHGAQAPRCAAG